MIVIHTLTRKPKGLVIPCQSWEFLLFDLWWSQMYNLWPLVTWEMRQPLVSTNSKDLIVFTSHLKRFSTSGDLKWPLNPSKTTGLFLSTLQIYKPNMKSVHHCYLEISCLQDIHAFDLHQKKYGSSSQHDKSIYNIWKVSVIAILRYCDYKQFNTRFLQFYC